MPYIPTSFFRFGVASGVKTLAYFVAKGGSEGFLLTGGPEPLIMYLQGDRAGWAFPTMNMQSASGLIYEDIEIEVEPSTIYQPAYVEEPVGALIVTDTSMGINYLRQSRHSFTELGIAYLSDDRTDTSPTDNGSIGFKGWRIVKHVEDRTIELFKFEATKVADR